MKITDLELEQYGIYQNESWKPAAGCLNVIMGENESGKTTLLRFIRDMMFGYERGKWQGKKGNMGFLRADGSAYRIYRDGKNKWAVNDKGEEFNDELSSLWWHGLNRRIYEKIFAVGLEDLQGTSFLADDSVRSRFFMLQGGDLVSGAMKQADEEMEKLLVSSSQGKRRINQLLMTLAEVQEELECLSGQEKDFSTLQKKQALLKKEIDKMKISLAADQEMDKQLEKRLGAWEYYKRAREIKRQLQLSEQVKLFPSNGKEQWGHLVSRMKLIREQQEVLQPKIDEYRPRAKEEIIPWTGMEQELEGLYVDLGQWKQIAAEEEELKRTKADWARSFVNLGYALPLWDRALSLKDACADVDWKQGRDLAQSAGVRNNELHFWQQREPEVEMLEEMIQGGTLLSSEEAWRKYEADASKIEALLNEEAALTEKTDALSAQKDTRYTFWFWLGATALIAAVVFVIMFYMSLMGYTVLYGAVGASVLAASCFAINNHVFRRKENQIRELEAQIDEIKKEWHEVASRFPDHVPEDKKDLPAFHNMLQAKRSDFYGMQAKQQAFAWKRETVKKQQSAHKDWAEEGKLLKEAQAAVLDEWYKWLEANKLPKVLPEKVSELQEQWNKIYAEEGRGKIIDVRIDGAQEKLAGFAKRAGSIIRAAGMSCPITPESIAYIYEENKKRNLEWRSISEKNRQHDEYEREMNKLKSDWASCEREMNALFRLVNAVNAEDFAEKVNAHENHDRLLKDWENVRHDIRLYAGGEEEFNRLWATLESGRYDEWMAEHQKLAEKIAKEEQELGDLQRQQGAAENEIFRLAGDDTITKTLQKKKELETEIGQTMEDWLTALFIRSLMGKTQKRYDSGKQPKIIKMANRFLGRMTKGKYSLIVNDDGKDVSIIDEFYRKKESKVWSSGTGDQVYLAIRLAMALSFGEQMETLPIVLDDIFVRFDEERQKETLRFLMELGKEQQIFLFTCHERTMKLAEEAGREENTGEFIQLRNGCISKRI